MSNLYQRQFSVWSKSSAMAAARAASFVVEDPFHLVSDELVESPRERKVDRAKALLRAQLHGLAFSPYVRGQAPGVHISEEQIRARLSLIRPYMKWARTFSCRHGNEAAPRIAHELGLKTLVGVELTEDREANEVELHNAIEVARAGHADILAVGNEVLLRADMTEDELLGYLERARAAVPNVPISYVDAYFVFEEHARLAAACDLLLVNCYPFWEGCPVEYAVWYLAEMVRVTKGVAGDKPVVVAETGWPTAGSATGGAVPSLDNALAYFVAAGEWARESDVPIFYFAAYDEAWKVAAEGDVGAFWGLWDERGDLKFG